MKEQKHPRWHTPRIEALEIDAPKRCKKGRWPQALVCEEQGEPQNSIPCHPGQKGNPNQPFS